MKSVAAPFGAPSKAPFPSASRLCWTLLVVAFLSSGNSAVSGKLSVSPLVPDSDQAVTRAAPVTPVGAGSFTYNRFGYCTTANTPDGFYPYFDICPPCTTVSDCKGPLFDCAFDPGVSASVCVCGLGLDWDGGRFGSCRDTSTCNFKDYKDDGQGWSSRYGSCVFHASCAINRTDGSPICTCNPGFSGDGSYYGACTKINYCATNNGGCSVNADCRNSFDVNQDNYLPARAICTCRRGFVGDGRVCTAKINVLVTVPAKSVRRGRTVSLVATFLRADNRRPIAGINVRFIGAFRSPGLTTNAAGVVTFSYRVPAATTIGRKTVWVQFYGTTIYNPRNGVGTLTVTR